MDGGIGARVAQLTSEGDQHPHQHGAHRAVRPAESPRRIEVITGADRRRRWGREEKARITAESFAPGETVAGVARRHGMSLGLLYYWRRCAREDTGAGPVSFVPVVAAEGVPIGRRLTGEGGGVAGPPGGNSRIEIELGGARIRLEGPVDGAALGCVIAALRAAT
jgi:transposase